MEAPTGFHWCCLARRKECSRPSCLESLGGKESLWPMRGEKYAFRAGLCIIARSSLQRPHGYLVFLGGGNETSEGKEAPCTAACCGRIPLAIALQLLSLSGLGWAVLRLMRKDSTALGWCFLSVKPLMNSSACPASLAWFLQQNSCSNQERNKPTWALLLLGWESGYTRLG